VHHIPYANCYRCAYGQTPDKCHVECVKVLEDTLFKTILPAKKSPELCGSDSGEGGYVVPPAKFHEELRRVADKYGILLIHTKCKAAWTNWQDVCL